jgi:hypothetical protein
VQGPHAIREVLAEHADGLRRLESVHDKLGSILADVIDQPERC